MTKHLQGPKNTLGPQRVKIKCYQNMLKCTSFSQGDAYSLITVSDYCTCEFQKQAVTLIIFINSTSRIIFWLSWTLIVQYQLLCLSCSIVAIIILLYSLSSNIHSYLISLSLAYKWLPGSPSTSPSTAIFGFIESQSMRPHFLRIGR